MTPQKPDQGELPAVRSPTADLQLASLLHADEPPPYRVAEGSAASPYVITCDHAGSAVPRALGSLGLEDVDLERHIAWDIGAAGVATRLASRLDAWLITQPYSRLVIDCNRPLDAPDSIARRSEDIVIPGNERVSAAEAELRARSIFHPYHQRIVGELDRRRGLGQPTILIALHSFTPTFTGAARRWHVGVLYHRDPRLARLLLASLRRDPALVVGDNQPYAVSDETDYGIVHYGERRGLPHVELEIRQDLIFDHAGQQVWAERFAQLLREAAPRLAEEPWPG